MALSEIGLYQYRKAETAPGKAPQKWSWAQTMWFILLTCGSFWALVIALILGLF